MCEVALKELQCSTCFTHQGWGSGEPNRTLKSNKDLDIQQGTSVWVGSPKSQGWPGLENLASTIMTIFSIQIDSTLWLCKDLGDHLTLVYYLRVELHY